MSNINFEGDKYYTTANNLTSVGKKLIAIGSAYKQETELSEMRLEELDNALYLSDKLGLSIRNCLDDIDYSNTTKDITYKFLTPDYPVTVDFDGSILKVKTPLTFKRMYIDRSLKANYQIMKHIKYALYKYQEDNHIDLSLALELPLTMVLVRKSARFNRTVICDNDNLENGRIINEIMSVLGYNDSPKEMDLYSTYKTVIDKKDAGMEFVIGNKRTILTHILNEH